MRLIATGKILGILLMIFSLSMLTPLIISAIYGDGAILPFVSSFAITLLTGFILWLLCRGFKAELKVRDGFLVVALFWIVLSLFGAIPFIMDPVHKLSITNAVFEAVSGLTTTGATVLSHLHRLPHAILYYRQQLHFLGGMGIIVLAVAILPMLGVGGMQMVKAETTGPIKDTKLKPRMAETAKALWSIYVGLCALCALAYWLAGMSFFDAIGESFSTISTGGFAIHDSSFAFYHSYTIDVIGIVFMFLGALNFGLHFQFMQDRKLSGYFRDAEFRAYFFGLLTIILLLTGVLMLYHYHQNFFHALINVAFTVVSMSSTTGLGITNFNHWPTFMPYFIMIVALVGGCSGSTAGGIKIIRLIILRAQVRREMDRLVHPQAVKLTKLKGQTLSPEVIQAVWGFFAAFIFLFVVLLMLLLADGNTLVNSFSELAACISNTGAGMGIISTGFNHMSAISKWILIFSMIAGRLEIFTLLVLFTADFWRN